MYLFRGILTTIIISGKGALSTPIQTSLRSLFENPPSFVVMANVAILWRCIIVFNENNTSLYLNLL